MTRFHGAWKVSLGVLLVWGFASMPALEARDFLGFEPQYWEQSMSGMVRVDGDTLRGTEIDLGGDLGLEENDRVAAGRFWIHWLRRNYLIFTAFDSRRSGDEVLSSPLVFNDQTFSAGERVKSRVETDLKSLLYGYNFLDLRLIKVGFRVGANRLGFDAKLSSSTVPVEASSSESVTFPVAGLGVAFEPMPWLRFVGEAAGIGGSIGSNDVTFYDARVQAEIYWAHFFGMIVGYRRMKAEADLEEFGAADVTQKGPYAGFVFRF